MAKMAKISGGIEGLADLKRTFKDLAPREARNLVRNVQFGVAQEVRDRVRLAAPQDTGTLRKAIKAVRRRGTPDVPVSEVIVTRGKTARHDAFYWFFLEFGTVRRAADPFVTPTVEEMRPQLPGIYREQFMKKYERVLAQRARRGGK